MSVFVGVYIFCMIIISRSSISSNSSRLELSLAQTGGTSTLIHLTQISFHWSLPPKNVTSLDLKCHFHQKLNGSLPTDPQVSCDPAIRYSGLGVRSVGHVGDFLESILISEQNNLISQSTDTLDLSIEDDSSQAPLARARVPW